MRCRNSVRNSYRKLRWVIKPIAQLAVVYLPLTMFITSDTTNKIKKTPNIILAIPAAEPAIQPNTKTAATIATTKNINAQRNIMYPFIL